MTLAQRTIAWTLLIVLLACLLGACYLLGEEPKGEKLLGEYITTEAVEKDPEVVQFFTALRKTEVPFHVVMGRVYQDEGYRFALTVFIKVPQSYFYRVRYIRVGDFKILIVELPGAIKDLALEKLLKK